MTNFTKPVSALLSMALLGLGALGVPNKSSRAYLEALNGASETPVLLSEAIKAEKAPKVIDVDGVVCRLTMEDNFDGNDIDQKYWSRMEEGTYNWNISQDMVWVEDGNLYVGCAESDQYSENGNVIGVAWTKDKFEQKCGYFEAKILTTKSLGVNSAWWMVLGDAHGVEDLGVDGAEIDILETMNRTKNDYTNQVSISVHVDNSNDQLKTLKTRPVYPASFYDEWHTYGFLWTEDNYVFYIDGEKVWSTNKFGICEHPGYLILSTGSGDWMNTNNEELPDAMRVDWVRVYQLDELSK